jgi:hypothetical protein
MSTIRFDDNRGGLAYPFLCPPANNASEWQIVARPFADEQALTSILQTEEATLRWVKDDKVLDLHIPGQDTETFLAQSGLRLSLAKGGYVLSKRLSRIMRPYRYYGFFDENDVTIDYNEFLNGRLWDGSGLVSRGFIQRLADKLELDDPHRHELLHSNRFEVTTLHQQGQDKGHVYVVDDLAVDFTFPAGSVKQELALVNGQVFIGLQPVHSDDQMCLDVQSLINLYPFFQPEQLLAWAQMESEMFLQGIAGGRLAGILGRLYEVDTAATGLGDSLTASGSDSLATWHLGEYLASGGSLMWFSGTVKAVAKQHLKRLGQRIDKLRLPCPGGRYYLFPAAVGERHVPSGQVELDPDSATAWVNDQDWLDYIVEVLGGCDGDDAVWVMPFSDRSDKGQQKLLLWRSPNQLGEYILLQPTANSHTISWETAFGPLTYPKMESRLLPPRIDSCHYQYGSLAKASDQSNSSHSIHHFGPTANHQACLCQPGSAGRLLQCSDALPGVIRPFTRPTASHPRRRHRRQRQNRAGPDPRAGLEQNGPETHGPARSNQSPSGHAPSPARPAAPLAARTGPGCRSHHQPPLAGHPSNGHRTPQSRLLGRRGSIGYGCLPAAGLFEQGREWLTVGKELRRVYSQALRQAAYTRAQDSHLSDDERQEAIFAAGRQASQRYLAQWSGRQGQVLLGAAAYLYAQGADANGPVRDGLLWQLGQPQADGQGRQPGIAHQFMAVLRRIGLLGEPTWTREGLVVYYHETPTVRPAGVPVRLNGVWANLVGSAERPYLPTTERHPRARTRASQSPDCQLCAKPLPGHGVDHRRDRQQPSDYPHRTGQPVWLRPARP